MSEDRFRRDVSRGEHAKRIMSDELIIEAFAKIENEIDTAWKSSHSDEEKIRYNAYIMHRLLTNFRGQFQRIIATGNVARKELLKYSDSKLKRFIHNA